MSGMMRKLAYSCIFMKRTRWGFTHAATLMPGERLGRKERWMAGRRAKPDYPVHIPLVPEKPNNDGLSFPVDSPALTANLCAYPGKHFGMKDRKKAGSA